MQEPKEGTPTPEHGDAKHLLEATTQHDDSAGVPPAPALPPPGEHDSWWTEFHLYAFLSLTWADTRAERRELVWIRRFFEQHGNSERYTELCREITSAQEAHRGVERLVGIASARMSMAEKRRFAYNMAQLCKSKGGISNEEYERILDVSGRLGIRDTDADSIINSVFSINDTFMAIVGLFALGAILYFTRVVIVPLVIAIFITMIINQVDGLVARLLKIVRWRPLTKIASLILVVGLLCGLGLAAAHSAKDFSSRLPYYEVKLATALDALQQEASTWGIAWPDPSRLSEDLRKLPIAATLSNLLGSVFTLVGNFVLVMVFVGFLTLSTSKYEGILQEMNEKITAYVSVKTMVSALTGIAVYLLCLGFGIDFALFWALVVFLLNFIPTVGSIVASIPPIALAALQLDSWAAVAAFATGLTLIHTLIGQILEPKLMGDKLAVKPVAILLGLIFWGFLWGIPGMFLAAPLMALLRILSSYFNFSREFERLLAAD